MDDQLCPACNGSGEGQSDGAVCGECHGSGVQHSAPSPEDRADYERTYGDGSYFGPHILACVAEEAKLRGK